MSISIPSRPRCLAVLVVFAALFLPAPNAPVERNAQLDVELVRSAECEYRGITASFEELSRAYALRVYREARFLGWEARPNPRHPEAEALVAGTFSVAGLQDEPPASWGRGPRIRDSVGDRVAVTWCLNNLGVVRKVQTVALARKFGVPNVRASVSKDELKIRAVRLDASGSTVEDHFTIRPVERWSLRSNATFIDEDAAPEGGADSHLVSLWRD